MATFYDLAVRVLNESESALSAEQIWQHAMLKGYTHELGSKGKTPIATLAARIYDDLKNGSSIFVQVSKRPAAFSLKTKIGLKTIPLEEEAPIVISSYTERDLHRLLTYFAYHNLDKCYTLSIDHTKSKRTEYAEWVHPDIIGCSFHSDWDPTIRSLSKIVKETLVQLYSFELKKSLYTGNLRNSFFQAVSNSSWAHEGYLVAAEISQDIDFQDELKRLCGSFGIGVIWLDCNDPVASRILFPAVKREYLDWEALNKLASLKNHDILTFLDRVKRDYTGDEIREEKYDRIFSSEEIQEHFLKLTQKKS